MSDIENSIVDMPVQNEPEIGNIDLSSTRKKRFTIDGDPNRILELNTSDLTIVNRLEEVYPHLLDLSRKAMSQLPDDLDVTTQDGLRTLSEALADIDAEMRGNLDYIFDSNVSQVCAPSGSMYDPFDGKFRFEHIIEKLSDEYENNMKKEYRRISAKVQKHTSKYVK